MSQLRFCANLSILFTELPLLDRPAAAAAAGFKGVELWWPFPEAVPPGTALHDLAQALDDAGVQLIGLNFDAGDLAAGDRGLVSLPGEGARFEDNVACVVSFAATQGTQVLNALYGNRVDSVAPEVQECLALERLAFAADAATKIGANVVLETQNQVDSPRYPLTRADQAVALVHQLRDAGHQNVGLLCDFYHLAMEGADLPGIVDTYGSYIRHVQIADAPGRHEPGTGTVDFDTVLRHLRTSRYAGWVGCEYRPSGLSSESFGWMDSQ